MALLLTSGTLSVPEESKSIYALNLWVDIPVIAGGALGTLAMYIFERQLITRRCPCDPAEINALDRPAVGHWNPTLNTISDVTIWTAMAFPIIGDLIDVGFSKTLFEDMVVYAEIMSVGGTLATILEFSVQRPRPRVYSGHAPELLDHPNGYRSFYSGHVSNAFSALFGASMTLYLRHRVGVWPWIVSAVIGSTIAVERVLSGSHFFTDVALGAAMGAVTGTLIPLLHAKEGPFAQASFGARPVASPDNAVVGGVITWTLRH